MKYNTYYKTYILGKMKVSSAFKNIKLPCLRSILILAKPGSQTPKKSLDAVHRVFLPTLNNNDYKNNKGIFCLKEIAFVRIYRLGFGVGCIGLVLKLKMVSIVMI